MKTQVVFEPENGYLRVRVRGRYPSGSYSELLRGVLDETNRLRLNKILVDCRDVAAPESEVDRFKLGVAIADLFGQRFKIAILYPPELINKFTEDTAVNRGADVLVVGEEASALDWLGVAGI